MRSLLFLVCTGLSLLGSCASSGSGGQGDALRVTLRSYGSDQQFELVSESHTDRIALYSEKRQVASTKVQLDAVMAKLVAQLNSQGLGDHAQNGAAPRSSNGLLARGLEIERNGTTSHWVIGKGSDVRERLAFGECQQTFLDLYNITQAFQAIENEEGTVLFQQSQANASSRLR